MAAMQKRMHDARAAKDAGDEAGMQKAAIGNSVTKEIE